MRQALAPILFEDCRKAEVEASRQCPVAPASRSADADKKARSKRIATGEPVQRSQRPLKALASFTKNTVTFSGASFKKVSRPTSIQWRAIGLLGISSLM